MNYDELSLEFKMTGVCGIYCGECECYKAKDNPQLMVYLINAGINEERLPCPGCREVKGDCPAIGTKCMTYICAKERGVNFCFECSDFPCDKLNPSADRANVFPHNLKVFNLCYIQNHGLEKFAEQASMFKQKYFKGRMMIGKGPQFENQK